jgi:hypothetical protein
LEGKWKKLFGPVITIGLVLAYFIFILFILVQLSAVPLRGFGMFLGFAIPLALMGVAVYVLVERIQEIRSGEEDDLSKY